MSWPMDADDKRWLDERLGTASPALRALVAEAVFVHDWWLREANDYRVELVQYYDKSGSHWILTIWRNRRGFVTSRLEHVEVRCTSRRVDDARSWLVHE